MNTPLPATERLLATVLQYGTWIASGVVALGLARTLVDRPAILPSGTSIITAGIALLILLPVARVALMLAVFVRQRDYRFAAIAALVLAIIVLGAALGLHMATAAPG
jgi:uncharacterized membrane protein